MLQDILNARHIAKVEESNASLVRVLDAYHYGDNGKLIRQHQAFVLGELGVLSFEEGG